jgi:hypothetical protein
MEPASAQADAPWQTGGWIVTDTSFYHAYPRVSRNFNRFHAFSNIVLTTWHSKADWPSALPLAPVCREMPCFPEVHAG